MSVSLNEAKIIGYVGKEPEIKTTKSGNKVANFSIATSKKFKRVDGNEQEQTQWHNIIVWGKLADVVEKYVHKGSQIYACGDLETRDWDKDGVKHYKTEINCKELLLLGSKSKSNDDDHWQPSQQYNMASPESKQDDPLDLPF